MNDVTLGAILQTEGCSLEVKACEILENQSFACERNPVVEYGDIDIFSYSVEYNSIFIIQCKGSSQDKILTLHCNTDKSVRAEPHNTFLFDYIPHRRLPRLQYNKQD